MKKKGFSFSTESSDSINQSAKVFFFDKKCNGSIRLTALLYLSFCLFIFTSLPFAFCMKVKDFCLERKLYLKCVDSAVAVAASSYMQSLSNLHPASFLPPPHSFHYPGDRSGNKNRHLHKKTITHENHIEFSSKFRARQSLLNYKDQNNDHELNSVSPKEGDGKRSHLETKSEKDEKVQCIETKGKFAYDTNRKNELKEINYKENSDTRSIPPLPSITANGISPSTNVYSRFERIEPRQTEILLSGPFSPLERVVISADGNLQRIMSAYYNAPIQVEILNCEEIEESQFQRTVELSVLKEVSLESNTISNDNHVGVIPKDLVETNLSDKNSIVSPIVINERKRIFCIAKSTIITCTNEAKDLIKQKELGIGQIFRKLEVQPHFQLLNAGRGERIVSHNVEGRENKKLDSIFGNENFRPGFWRSYKLSCKDLVCIIEETFADDTFVS